MQGISSFFAEKVQSSEIKVPNDEKGEDHVLHRHSQPTSGHIQNIKQGGSQLEGEDLVFLLPLHI